VLLGAHCSGGVKKALDRAAALGVDSLQLFVQSPRAWRFPDHDPADLTAFRERRAELAIGAVVVHALYLVNLASPNDDFYSKSVTTLRSTVDAACAIEADAVIFHVGSHQGAGFEAALERVVPALAQALERCSETTWLLIENSAGAGGTIGRSLDELAALYEALDRHERLGVCLDSCHLWVSGYDVTDREALDGLLRELDERIGLDRLRALHVNDAQAPARLEPRPAREHRRRAARREARRVPRPPVAAGPAGGDGGPGPGQPRAGRERAAETPRAARQMDLKAAARRDAGPQLRTCAKTRNVGRPTGSSENSGLTQPSSSPRWR
jgi:deoxyribonuclease-4